MKKCVSYALVLMLCVSVQGCAGQTAESEIQPSTQIELEVETQQEVETESGTESETAETEETAGDLQVNTVIGSLVDIDMKQITVLSDNGNEIILPINGAELDFRNGFRVGNLVSVDYTGEILETDNLEADISVLRAADSSDIQELKVSAPRQKTEEESESGAAAEDNAESEGEAATEGSTESESEAATEESTEAESEAATENSTEAESEAATDDSTESEEEVKILRGKIQKMEWNSMTIMTDEQEEQTFGIMNVRMYFSKGMAKGTAVVVSYTGDFTGEEQKVLSVVDAESFKEKEKE